MDIVKRQKQAGKCIGFCIKLGKEFFSTGVSQVDNELLPMLIDKAPPGVSPRLIPSYATLLWFTLKVRSNIS